MFCESELYFFMTYPGLELAFPKPYRLCHLTSHSLQGHYKAS